MTDRFAEPFAPPPSEKDKAVQIARRILADPHGLLALDDLAVLARQYLRELHLPQTD